jgi:hypothetical protein
MFNNLPGGNMKSAHIVIAVLFIAGCVMNGCTQDKLPTEAAVPDVPHPPTGAGVLRANIDGRPWAAEDIAGIPLGTSTYSGNILHICGVRPVVGDTADAETIDLIIDWAYLNTDISPGTYQLGTIPAQAGEAQHFDGMSCVCHTDRAHSGTVTITGSTCPKSHFRMFAFNGIESTGNAHFPARNVRCYVEVASEPRAAVAGRRHREWTIPIQKCQPAAGLSCYLKGCSSMKPTPPATHTI